MWITREALAEAGKCIAQNAGRQPVQTAVFVCVGSGGGGDGEGGGRDSYSALGTDEPHAEGTPCEFMPWPLDPLTGALLFFSPLLQILSVIGDACYAAETLADWVKEDAHSRGVPLPLARINMPVTGTEVASRLLYRAGKLGGKVARETLSSSS